MNLTMYLIDSVPLHDWKIVNVCHKLFRIKLYHWQSKLHRKVFVAIGGLEWYKVM